MPSPLESAVTTVKTQAALARAVGVSQGLVWQWLAGRSKLMPHHAIRIETATGVRCEELCPHVVWTRDPGGQVTGYTVPVAPAETRAA